MISEISKDCSAVMFRVSQSVQEDSLLAGTLYGYE